ncbi:MAG: hypothetical protein COB93_02170 [Sneathiella sp.]|nr:MAG: hypothetical protein COB93_02170 [Sneathiella sp.]
MEKSDVVGSSLIEHLINYGELKVWSVLVTILGDLAPRAGMYIPGPALAALTGRIGIKPQALRVAIHRLRKEGWIEGTKIGRVSHYALSEMGRLETERVEPEVYGSVAPERKQPYLLVIPPRSTDKMPPNAIKLSRDLYLSDHIPPSIDGLLTISGENRQWPDWVQEAVLPPQLAEQHEALTKLLSADHEDPADLEPFDRIALRILILHNWRRLVLRRSPLAPLFWDKEWIGTQCQYHVTRWLTALSRDDAQKAIHGAAVSH